MKRRDPSDILACTCLALSINLVRCDRACQRYLCHVFAYISCLHTNAQLLCGVKCKLQPKAGFEHGQTMAHGCGGRVTEIAPDPSLEEEATAVAVGPPLG